MEIQLQVMNERKFRCPFNHVFNTSCAQSEGLFYGEAYILDLHTLLLPP